MRELPFFVMLDGEADWIAVIGDVDLGVIKWTWEETVLAFELFVNSGGLNGGVYANENSKEARALSLELQTLGVHDDIDYEEFRNLTGVVRKLGNLRAAERQVRLAQGDPDAEGLKRGLKGNSSVDREVFAYYQDRLGDLASDAAAIRASLSDGPPPTSTAGPLAEDAPIDGGGAAHYLAKESPGGTRSRSEAVLVEEYAERMRALGYEVTGRRYRIPGESQSLRADVVVRRQPPLLVESKAAAHRFPIRTAIGQLIDYRRFEPMGTRCAILVPARPAEDLMDLVETAGFALIWKDRQRFVDSVEGAATT